MILLMQELIATQANDCFGDTNGELELTIANYVGAYTYQLLDGSGTPIGGPVIANTSTNPQLILGLDSGNYSVDIVEMETHFVQQVQMLSLLNPLQHHYY